MFIRGRLRRLQNLYFHPTGALDAGLTIFIKESMFHRLPTARMGSPFSPAKRREQVLFSPLRFAAQLYPLTSGTARSRTPHEYLRRHGSSLWTRCRTPAASGGRQ
jgi:hypothetical protein